LCFAGKGLAGIFLSRPSDKLRRFSVPPDISMVHAVRSETKDWSHEVVSSKATISSPPAPALDWGTNIARPGTPLCGRRGTTSRSGHAPIGPGLRYNKFPKDQ